ncbi:hypothetical protein GYH30_006753 [Glycine max]|uniref:Leucine-rich repeat-containing N-terminal plant-type domain-containing protein n=1 Tax=Glycine max TaxID=3847 RepID=A0A0R0KGT8_SOYBN|nr:hypothetical protein GYH30_006753 [Glycine max]
MGNDIFCLKSIKESLRDPYNYLQSWNFNNKMKALFVSLMGLNVGTLMRTEANFLVIQNCTSLTGLDFSINTLSGTIPENTATLLPFVTSLDQSSNKFSGAIPMSLANCTDLNALKLDQNRLSYHFPQQLGLLQRPRTFTVSNNSLTGPVPNFTNGHVVVNYSNNEGLCGPSLRPCPNNSSTGH